MEGMKVVITGANSAVGQAILRCAAVLGAPQGAAPSTFVAAVRSDRAAEEIRRLLGNGNGIVRISYDDPESLSTAFREASAVIHLPGVLVERPGSTYEQANVAPVDSVVEADKAWRLVRVCVPPSGEAAGVSPFTFSLRKDKLRAAIRSECRYLLRSNDLPGADPASLG